MAELLPIRRKHYIMLYNTECDSLTYCRGFSSGAVTTCFNELNVVAGIRTPNLPHAGQKL